MKLVIENMSASYGRTAIITDINAHVEAGEFIGVIGCNGAGKTCVLKTIAGLLNPQAGNISIDGKGLHSLSARDRARRIAYLAQNRHMAWALSVRDLVALGRAPYRSSLRQLSTEDEVAIDTALRITHCTDLQNRHFEHLSGGEQMRVHLARALAVEAPLLLADEPTTALDPYHQISILRTLRETAKAGRTVIANLHDLTLAKQFCTRIWVIDNGSLCADGAPEQVFTADMLASVFNIHAGANGWEALSENQT